LKIEKFAGLFLLQACKKPLRSIFALRSFFLVPKPGLGNEETTCKVVLPPM